MGKVRKVEGQLTGVGTFVSKESSLMYIEVDGRRIDVDNNKTLKIEVI